MIDGIRADLSLRFPSSTTNEPDLKVNLNIPSRGVTAIFGPSGSGKTTLLRCLTGLEKHVHGEIIVNQDVWLSSNTRWQPHKRNVGYVPQQPSLFTHLTVEQNLLYGLKRQRTKHTKNELLPLIELLGLSKLLSRFPHGLSMGEQQRVAIARAIIPQPALLLMDEPLASLDIQNKREILGYLSHIRSTYSMPIVYVTHSVDEVVQLADKLVLVEQGRVTNQGTTLEVFPKLLESIAVNDKIFLTGQVKQDTAHNGRVFIDLPYGKFWLSTAGFTQNKMALISFSSDDIVLSRKRLDATNLMNQFSATIESVNTNQTTLQTEIIICALGQTFPMVISSLQQENLSLAQDDNIFLSIVRADIIA